MSLFEMFKRHMDTVREISRQNLRPEERGRKIQESYNLNGIADMSPAQRHSFFNAYQKDKYPHLYMVTLTFDPKKISKFKNLDKEVSKFFDSLPKQKALCKSLPLTLVYSKEHHKSGAHHYHICLQTEKPCSKEPFRYWSRKFGQIDFSTSKTRDVKETLTYISKETVPKIILATRTVRELLDPLGPRKTSDTSDNSFEITFD